jgi:class 3 adenylate cyclase/tetratricopeptide (TPR) repeat protein
VFETAAPTSTAQLVGTLAPERIVELARAGMLAAQDFPAACERLRAELRAIASYVPETLLRQQVELPRPGRTHGAYWDGSVLFADLSGFTALSGKLSALGKQGAEEISAIINALFGALVDEVQRHGGELLKFGGDALTAFFHASTLGGAHAAIAASAALAMQERMVWFRAIETRGGTFSLKLRVGVHSGRVFAAQVGDPAHIELVVTGHDINRVALAQEIAEPGDVVITDATLALAHGAQAAPRDAGFHLLTALPDVAAPPRRWSWDRLPGLGQAGCARVEDLLVLADRIEALKPYLPHRLPRRFLEPGQGSAEIGEFRPVTVLFANFAPFSAALDLLGEDADTAAAVLNAYYRRAQAVVHRYDGIVNKVDMYTHGDKLMALFGAPAAHEDDPERAVRCALDMRAALEEANREIAELLLDDGLQATDQDGAADRDQSSVVGGRSSPMLTQKIGINTGVVFAGKVGSARRHEYTVMGQPVNLAARLMSAAEPGAAVISPSTRRASAGRFALRELPPARLKGVPEPVPLAEALRALDTAQESRGGLGRAALVGRDAELGLLLETGAAALRGSGRVVALTGEAGAGKTRLLEEALQRLVLRSGPEAGSADQLPPFLLYTVECQSYDQSSPYAAARTLLSQVFALDLYGGPGHAGAPAAVTGRVEALAPALARFAPLLADVLGLPFEETPLTAALSPEQRHDRVQELIEALVLAEAAIQPLVLILDDLQWCDASSLDLIGRLAAAASGAALLMLLGYRQDPPIPEPWRELPHFSRLTVGELAPEGAAALVRELLRAEPPPALGGLVEKAQGNPFFIEEVVRGLVEDGALAPEAGGWALTRELEELAVPDSVEGLIVARLDRLEERSRDVVQVAAVIGRRFGVPVLSGVMPQRPDLPRVLDRLSAAELVLTDSDPQAYLFKHALTRDVAYEAILYARRRELHRRVAGQIELLYAGRLDDQLALLARHYLLAEEWEPAFDYHLRAGRRAQQRFANRETIALLGRALEIAARLAPDHRAVEGARESAPTTGGADASVRDGGRSSVVGRPAAIVEVHERLGLVYALIGEYDTALARYDRALELLRAQPGATAAELTRLHHHIARVYEKRAAFDTAFEWVERALALGDDEQEERARCLLLGAGLHQRQGRYAQSLEWGERALVLGEQSGSLRVQAHALKLLGGTRFNLGEIAQAHALTARCVALFQQSRDLAGLADAHNDLALFSQELGRLDEARRNYEAGAEIKAAIGDVYGQAMIANNLGLLLAVQGELESAVEQYRRSLAMFERLGSLYATGVLHMNLGAAQMQRGALAEAGEHLRRGGELYAQAGAEDFLPELERYDAELALRRGDLDAALALCQKALATAVRLEARAEEGLTLRTLAAILEARGDASGAWEALGQSLAILRDAGNPLELGRTLLALAALAPQLGRADEGRSALSEALPALEAVGARRDLEAAHAVAARHRYTL